MNPTTQPIEKGEELMNARESSLIADAATGSPSSAGSPAGHTPGPWVLETGDSSHRFVHIADEDGRTIFFKYGSGTRAEAELDVANATLAALAPELLEVVRDLLEHSISHYGHPKDESYGVGRAHAWARALIAKATGHE